MKISFVLVILIFVYGCGSPEAKPVVKNIEVKKPSKVETQKPTIKQPINANYREVKQKYRTTKTSCVLQSEYKGKNQEELKKILLKKAKSESLQELYGTLMKTNLELNNDKITKDEIQQLSIGKVRVKGKPKYFNGQNWGEVCTTIETYITVKDFEKYKPKKIHLYEFCYNNPQIPTNEIQKKANYKAYKKAISKYKPSMKNISDELAESYIHGFHKSNEDFNFKTGVYCFDADITLLPYELELVKETPKNTYKQKKKKVVKIDKNLTKHGVKATFYTKNDFNFKNPIYRTVIEKNLWLKNKSFLNHKLQPNNIYQVKIEGYIRPEKDINHFKLISDVYAVKVKIDNNLILTDRKPISKVRLKGGSTYKLSIYIKTANNYDISLLAKDLQSESYTTVGLNSLYQ